MKKFFKRFFKYLGIFIGVILIAYFVITLFLNGHSNLYDDSQIRGQTFTYKIFHGLEKDKIHFFENGDYIRIENNISPFKHGNIRQITKGKYKINSDRTISLKEYELVDDTFPDHERNTTTNTPKYRRLEVTPKKERVYLKEYEIRKHYLLPRYASQLPNLLERIYPSRLTGESVKRQIKKEEHNYTAKYGTLSGKMFFQDRGSTGENYISFKNNKFIWNYMEEWDWDHYVDELTIIKGSYIVDGNKLILWNMTTSGTFRGHYADEMGSCYLYIPDYMNQYQKIIFKIVDGKNLVPENSSYIHKSKIKPLHFYGTGRTYDEVYQEWGNFKELRNQIRFVNNN